MYIAVQELKKIGGGCIAVDNGKVIGVLPLELFGLISSKDGLTALKENENVLNIVKKMGCNLTAPFDTLSFAALPNTIGNLKICPEGLIDVWKEEIVSVVVE